MEIPFVAGVERVDAGGVPIDRPAHLSERPSIERVARLQANLGQRHLQADPLTDFRYLLRGDKIGSVSAA